MRTVRRLYFYLTAFISLEVILWGAINLARTLFDVLPGGGTVDLLAGGLSLILVGLPIFLLHWTVVQRDARQDEDERATRLRALYLYGIQLATLVPVVQNITALANRALFELLDLKGLQALIGGGQTTFDNLVAIVINLTAWAYFESTLRAGWRDAASAGSLGELRRIYRYVWVLYSLGMTIAGAQQVLRFILAPAAGLFNAAAPWLANGLALLLTGTPLWAFWWLTAQRALAQPGERQSLMRTAVLYLLALGGALTFLLTAGGLLTALLRWMLGEAQTWRGFLDQNNAVLSLALIAGVLWAFFDRHLHRMAGEQPDAFRRASLERLYAYFLSLMGLAAVFLGAWRLLSSLTEMLLDNLTWSGGMISVIGGGFSALAVGLPVWLAVWPVMQREARQLNDAGAHARQSVERKGYLYLVLFLCVVGAMASGGMLIYLALNNLLGSPGGDFWPEFARRLGIFALVLVWLAYHLTALRRDGQLAQRTLIERHSGFPVLIFEANGSPFAEELLKTLQRQMPRLPAAVHRFDKSFEDERLRAARLVVMPAELAAHPPEALRLWLQEYQGMHLVVPLPAESWIWLGAPTRPLPELVKDTARLVRQMAEGQTAQAAAQSNPWVIAAYALAALFGLQALLALISLILTRF